MAVRIRGVVVRRTMVASLHAEDVSCRVDGGMGRYQGQSRA